MVTKYTVDFCVTAPTKPWESVCVVGNVEELGNWDPENALKLNSKTTDFNVWVGHIDVPADFELQYRYFICYYLDPDKDEAAESIMIVTKWESLLKPRSIIPHLECSNNICKRQKPSTFGSYAGRSLVNDGWLMNPNQQEIRLRIHGQALNFYKKRHNQRVYRIKATPIRLGSTEVGTLDLDDDPDYEDGRYGITDPKLPTYSNTELSILSSRTPMFNEQLAIGQIFRNDKDYFVFRTQSVNVDKLVSLLMNVARDDHAAFP